MKTTNKGAGRGTRAAVASDTGRVWDEHWTYIKIVVDVVREPMLILDKDLRVMTANESFYRTFQVEPDDTEHKVVYELGRGQWNIPALKKLLEDILPQNSFFKGFEVAHEFPFIGHKVVILNARRIHFSEDAASASFPPIILLAMEDVTDMMNIAQALAGHANHLEAKRVERAQNMETHIGMLEKEISELKKKA